MTKIVTYHEAVAAGLKAYFTGRPCRKGHVTYRYVSNRGCFDCADDTRTHNYETQKQWREAHPNYFKEWLAKHPGYYKKRRMLLRKRRKKDDKTAGA